MHCLNSVTISFSPPVSPTFEKHTIAGMMIVSANIIAYTISVFFKMSSP